MGWVCKVCKKDHGGAKSDPRPKCFNKSACKTKGEYACDWVEDKEPEWKFESGRLTRASNSSDAEDDLEQLIANVGGNIYSSSIGTVVGGDAAKSGKRISGLKNKSARIDTQNPPKGGVYNLQYQVGTTSHAAVLFTDEDEQRDVLAKLLESLRQCKIAKSPNVK